MLSATCAKPDKRDAGSGKSSQTKAAGVSEWKAAGRIKKRKKIRREQKGSVVLRERKEDVWRRKKMQEDRSMRTITIRRVNELCDGL